MSARDGVVLAREGGRFRVATAGGEVTAILRGKAKQANRDFVVVGDRVTLDAGDDAVLGITQVAPRRNLLERRIPLGRGTRPVAANLDHVFVVVSTVDPAPVPQLVDRLCAIAEANEIPVAIVVNKVDLGPAEPIAGRMRRAGYPVFEVSARAGVGLEPLFAEFKDKESLLTGPSGAGKSSLLNRLQPGLRLRTAEVSAKDGRGRHTTVSAVMVPLLNGGWLVDTPGFSEVGLWGIEPRELASCFPEMREALERCKFADCRHLGEPGCAVLDAVAAGSIAPDRHESYRILLNELVTAPKDWE